MSFGWLPGTVMLSEIASCQMEFKYLAHLTGRSEYFEKVGFVAKYGCQLENANLKRSGGARNGRSQTYKSQRSDVTHSAAHWVRCSHESYV